MQFQLRRDTNASEFRQQEKKEILEQLCIAKKYLKITNDLFNNDLKPMMQVFNEAREARAPFKFCENRRFPPHIVDQVVGWWIRLKFASTKKVDYIADNNFTEGFQILISDQPAGATMLFMGFEMFAKTITDYLPHIDNFVLQTPYDFFGSSQYSKDIIPVRCIICKRMICQKQAYYYPEQFYRSFPRRKPCGLYSNSKLKPTDIPYRHSSPTIGVCSFWCSMVSLHHACRDMKHYLRGHEDFNELNGLTPKKDWLYEEEIIQNPEKKNKLFPVSNARFPQPRDSPENFNEDGPDGDPIIHMTPSNESSSLLDQPSMDDLAMEEHQRRHDLSSEASFVNQLIANDHQIEEEKEISLEAANQQMQLIASIQALTKPSSPIIPFRPRSPGRRPLPFDLTEWDLQPSPSRTFLNLAVDLSAPRQSNSQSVADFIISRPISLASERMNIEEIPSVKQRPPQSPSWEDLD